MFLASPNLEERLSRQHEGADGPGKLRRPLLAYLSRMAARPTPFGLFAACSTGRVAERTDLVVGGDLRRRTRPDVGFLVAATTRLSEDRDVREALVWRPNSSLYQAAGRLRLVESWVHGRTRSHHLVAIDADHPLLAVLDRARDGASIDEMAGQLVDEELSLDEAVEYTQTDTPVFDGH